MYGTLTYIRYTYCKHVLYNFTVDLCGKIEDILIISHNFAIALGKNHRSMQRIIQSKFDSSLLHIMDALMKDLGLRKTLEEIKLTIRK